MTRVRILVSALGVAVLMLGLTAPAVAQPYPPGVGANCVQTRDTNDNPQTRFRQGQGIVVVGEEEPPRRCFDAGADVVIDIVRNPVLVTFQTTADSEGNYRAQGTIPSEARPGRYTVVASGELNGEPIEYTAQITVTGPPPSRLPVTGADIALLAAWGVGLAAVGTVLVGATRRRRRFRRTG